MGLRGVGWGNRDSVRTTARGGSQWGGTVVRKRGHGVEWVREKLGLVGKG